MQKVIALEQRIEKLKQRKKALMHNSLNSAKAKRRARTRSLIQLGGLLEKAGLLDEFGIKLGADLQKDLEMQKPVAALFWGLLELQKIVHSEDFHFDLWTLKGKEVLGIKSVDL